MLNLILLIKNNKRIKIKLEEINLILMIYKVQGQGKYKKKKMYWNIIKMSIIIEIIVYFHKEINKVCLF
jgi:hypothetical protein